MTTPTAPITETSVSATAGVEAVVDGLARLAEELARWVSPAEIPGMVDDALLTVTGAVEALGRRVDALRIRCATEIAERSPKGAGSERLSAQMGCRTPVELIARVTGVSEATASRRVSLGAAVLPGAALTGEVLPPKFPAVAEAIDAGALGDDAARAIVFALGGGVRDRANPEDWAAAEAALVADAIGGFTADQTRVQAAVWRVALDPDGVDPDAQEAMRRRGLVRLGTRDGLVRYRMELMPEISGKLETALAAVVSPKTSPVFLNDEDALEQDAHDDRTSPQKRHDAFASLIDAAARSADVASMGGAAPTVLVRVDESDLVSGRGAGWIDGVDDPIPMAAITQFACAGGIQKVLMNSEGKILSLWSPDRCFTPQQRRAIAVRDGGCVIPGCRVPAGWCEVHHVQEHARGGPTHTDNGVTLCWFHHRSIDSGGWRVRMRDGVPQVRAPGWIDPSGIWRTVGVQRRKPRMTPVA
ncbi:HNH endonuclease signature motif containing protein [Humibacter sp. RRB41]|uniref:HNH endonuclease signature motif containing protein n=1 Tax=Humibacter sp. RRB41 TaxID=2919946 RepID=UPI001FA9A880|nr:HNH endonuclease signature motif containing protein [Humibacter sp. RRB41]